MLSRRKFAPVLSLLVGRGATMHRYWEKCFGYVGTFAEPLVRELPFRSRWLPRGGGSALPEGRGFPGDTAFSNTVVMAFYVNNDLVDPPVPPATVLPISISNEKQLTENVANRGVVGTCAPVSFAQLVYRFDVAAGAKSPYLTNVQFSYPVRQVFPERRTRRCGRLARRQRQLRLYQLPRADHSRLPGHPPKLISTVRR